MTGHLAKPIDPVRLYAVLAEHGAPSAAAAPDADRLATIEAPLAANDGSNTALAAILADLAELDRRLAS